MPLFTKKVEKINPEYLKVQKSKFEQVNEYYQQGSYIKALAECIPLVKSFMLIVVEMKDKKSDLYKGILVLLCRRLLVLGYCLRELGYLDLAIAVFHFGSIISSSDQAVRYENKNFDDVFDAKIGAINLARSLEFFQIPEQILLPADVMFELQDLLGTMGKKIKSI